jgi:hypothetical protein
MRVFRTSHRRWLLAFVVLALAARMLVPSGWMPSFADGRTTITLCTGAGMVEAWVDEDGAIHKEKPTGSSTHDQPCAFAGLGAVADTPNVPALAQPAILAVAASRPFDATNVAVGLGLAAPPPPAIGPPTLI